MWLFLNDAFFSVVSPPPQYYQPEEVATYLLVRSRFAGDIEKHFPGHRVEITPDRDYLYRALVPRQLVGDRIADQLRKIAYPNFKASMRHLSGQDGRRIHAYHDVWERVGEYGDDA